MSSPTIEVDRPLAAPPIGTPGERAAGRLRLLILVVSGAAFLDILDVTIVNLAFADLGRSFGGATVGDLAWVITGYAVMFAALLTPAGRLADVTGRRRVFLAGTAAFLAASLAAALAPSLEVLIAARVVQGAGAALTLPAGLGIVLAASPPERRAAAVGAWAAAGAVAALVGPSLGGVLVDAFGWRSVFLVNLPVGVLILFAAARLVPREDVPGGRRPDLAGTGLLAGGIALVVLALTQAPDWGWGSASTLGAALAGAGLAGWALRRSRRHPAPAVETALWRVRRFAAANAGSLMLGMAIYPWLLLCVLFCTQVWGYSELQAGLAVSPGAVTAALAAAYVGRLGERAQRAAVAAGALTVTATGAWLALALGEERRFLELWLPAGLLVGVGMGAAVVGLSSAAATAVEPRRFAAAIGLNLTARQVGGALGVAVLAAILQAGSGIDPFLAAFGFCALAALAAALTAVKL